MCVKLCGISFGKYDEFCVIKWEKIFHPCVMILNLSLPFFLGVIKMWFHFSSKIPSSPGGGWWICVTSFAQSLKQEECEEGKQILDH